MAQLFPDVLNATLDVPYAGASAAFVVPAQYAFAVVQVRILSGGNENGVSSDFNATRVDTSHGTYRSHPTSVVSNSSTPAKDFPVLNLIIPGGQSFQLLPYGSGTNSRVSITALCHRRPA